MDVLTPGRAMRLRHFSNILRDVLSLFAAGLFLVLVLAPAPICAQTAVYRGIPKGFDFPTDKAILERKRAAGDMAALRKHAGMLFGRMTRATPDGQPSWATWYRTDEAFAPRGWKLPKTRRVELIFLKPDQRIDPGPPNDPKAPRDSALSFVLFNREAFCHIRAEKLYLAKTLERINNSYAASTPWDRRTIPPFPARAIVLKTLWSPVTPRRRCRSGTMNRRSQSPNATHSAPGSVLSPSMA